MRFRSLFRRESLAGRVFWLSVSGMLLLLIALGLSASYGLHQNMEQMMRQRISITQTVAAHLDSFIQQNLSHLQNVGFSAQWNPYDGNPNPERSALHLTHLTSCFSKIVLVDPNGQLILSEPPADQTNEYSFLPLKEVLSSGKPSVSNLIKSKRQTSIWFLVPLRTAGNMTAIVAGQIQTPSAVLDQLIESLKTENTGSAEIVDGNGMLIAGHRSNLLQQNQKTADRKILLKEARGELSTESNNTKIVASVPLLHATWVLRFVQSEKETFASLHGIRNRMLFIGLLFFFIALPVVWGVTDSIVTPVETLIRGARQISAGDLDHSIAVGGKEEIGMLGKTLDEMRIKLRTLVTEIEKNNAALEKRVTERTFEVTRLYERLKEKEKMRGVLLHKIISAQEEERKRISRDLHDDLSQLLATLLLDLESVKEDITQPEVKSKLDRIKHLAVQAIDSIHRMIFDLRPAVLDDLGLSTAIRSYAEEWLKPCGIYYTIEGDALEMRLSSEVEIALFRIAQEAINNIARHARAQNVTISLEQENSSIVLTVEDDGSGFEPSHSTSSLSGHGFGLQGMRERVELLEGHFDLKSSRQSGTRISVSVPLKDRTMVYA